MHVKRWVAAVALLLALFVASVFAADTVYAGLSQALARGEYVVPAKRDASRWGDARCNDGTPYGFVVQKSPSNSPVWVIYLQGGVMCDDYSQQCSQRQRSLTTALKGSDGGPAPMIAHDILSRDRSANPTFYDANFAFGHYCSSDLWSGNTANLHPNSASAKGWYFSGRIDLRAMVEVLIDRYGLNDANPNTQVLFTGSSAGGVGVVANADVVAGLLPKTAAAKRLRLVNDGGFFLEFNLPGRGFGDARGPFVDVLTNAYDFWGSALNPLCEQAQRAAGKKPGECFFGAPSYPFLAGDPPDGLGLPTFVAEASIDANLFQLVGIRFHSAADRPAVEAWRTTALTALQDIPWLFSAGDAPYHILLPSDGWLKSPPGGPSLRDLITSFWNGGTPQRVIWGNP